MTKKPPASYHHGHLRSALIDSALQILRSDGLEALSLRAAARKAGVSQSAPYHHFDNKLALLAAVAERGFRLFRTALQEAGDGVADAAERLSRLGAGYVHFALEEPALFRLMFGPDLVPFSDFPELEASAADAYEELRSAVSEARGGRGAQGSDDHRAASVSAWAHVHGLAVLLLDRRLPVEPGEEGELVRRVMETVTGRFA